MDSSNGYPRLNAHAKKKLANFKKLSEQEVLHARQDRFLILCRQYSTEAKNLERILSKLGKTEVICDTPSPEAVWYSDEEVEGFGSLMGAMKFSKFTAWSRALFHIEVTQSFNERVWFVEEDVAGHPDAFKALVNLTHKYPADLHTNSFKTPSENPDWYWWQHLPDKNWFKNPVSSFNPLCCMSSELLRDILSFREEKGRFTFHEVLFASVASKNGRGIVDWMRIPETEYLFGTFHWRPEINSLRLGISHPVKDPTVHTLISTLSRAE